MARYPTMLDTGPGVLYPLACAIQPLSGQDRGGDEGPVAMQAPRSLS